MAANIMRRTGMVTTTSGVVLLGDDHNNVTRAELEAVRSRVFGAFSKRPTSPVRVHENKQLNQTIITTGARVAHEKPELFEYTKDLIRQYLPDSSKSSPPPTISASTTSLFDQSLLTTPSTTGSISESTTEISRVIERRVSSQKMDEIMSEDDFSDLDETNSLKDVQMVYIEQLEEQEARAQDWHQRGRPDRVMTPPLPRSRSSSITRQMIRPTTPIMNGIAMMNKDQSSPISKLKPFQLPFQPFNMSTGIIVVSLNDDDEQDEPYSPSDVHVVGERIEKSAVTYDVVLNDTGGERKVTSLRPTPSATPRATTPVQVSPSPPPPPPPPSASLPLPSPSTSATVSTPTRSPTAAVPSPTRPTTRHRIKPANGVVSRLLRFFKYYLLGVRRDAAAASKHKRSPTSHAKRAAVVTAAATAAVTMASASEPTHVNISAVAVPSPSSSRIQFEEEKEESSSNTSAFAEAALGIAVVLIALVLVRRHFPNLFKNILTTLRSPLHARASGASTAATAVITSRPTLLPLRIRSVHRSQPILSSLSTPPPARPPWSLSVVS